jgi:predicted DNA-binding WGR domain protein
MIYYEKIRPELNSKKFYEMWWEPATLKERCVWRLWTKRGRIGTKGTMILEEFDDFGDFSKKMRELHNTRINHGYDVKPNQAPHQMSVSASTKQLVHNL